MECKICGAAVPEGAERCPECGVSLAQPSLDPVREPAAEVEAVLAAEPAEAPEAEILTEAGEETPEETAEEALCEAALEEAAEEEQPQMPLRKRLWVRVTAIVLAVVLVLGIAAGVWYNVNGGFLPRENNLYFRDNYTVSDSKAVAAMDKVVATMGDLELTNGLLQVFYWDQVFSFLQNYGSYASYLGLDPNQPLYEQYLPDGSITWEQYFLEMALNIWQRYEAIVGLAQAEGFAMPEELKQHLESIPQQLEQTAQTNNIASVEELLAQDMGPGCTLEDYIAQLELLYYASSYVDHLYSQMEPTQEEIKAHVQAHAEDMLANYGVSLDSGDLVDVRHILIQPENCEFDDSRFVVADDAQWAQCEAKAQELMEQWKTNGADEEAFATLAMANSVDGSAAQGGLIADITTGQTVENFNNWCFDAGRKAGDVGIVRTEFGYHLIYFVAAEPGWLRYGKDDLMQYNCGQIIDKAVAENPIQVNFKAIVLGQSMLGKTQ